MIENKLEYEEELKELEKYAKDKNIRELTSEDIMKLLETPYLMEDIEKAFEISPQEFKKIRKEKEISSSYLEMSVRNMLSLVSHIDKKYFYLSNQIRNEMISLLVEVCAFPVKKTIIFKSYP